MEQCKRGTMDTKEDENILLIPFIKECFHNKMLHHTSLFTSDDKNLKVFIRSRMCQCNFCQWIIL